ncbi:MAG: hypothetical protein E7352_07390 [Clostridiales bacterium]|nr:hypothetical protein [Clostridiales bacterium]
MRVRIRNVENSASFELTKGNYSFGKGYNYSAICTGVTSALSVDTGLSRSATEFYNELIASGMSKPSEQYTFNTTEKLSLGWVQKFYKSGGSAVFYNANCVCEISASAFVNWGAC